MWRKGQCHLFLVFLWIAKKHICFNGGVKILVEVFLKNNLTCTQKLLLTMFGCGWPGRKWIATWFVPPTRKTLIIFPDVVRAISCYKTGSLQIFEQFLPKYTKITVTVLFKSLH